MRIEYIVQARMPTEKAHGLQIAHMCAALANQGNDVTLVVPNRHTPIKESVFSYYGVREDFTMRMVWSPDLVSKFGRYGAWVQYLHSFLFVLRLCFYRPAPDALIYTRTPEIAWFFKLRGFGVVCEIHDWPESFGGLFTYFLKKVDLIPCNSPGTQKVCNEHGLMQTMLAHNGITLSDFTKIYDRDAVRRDLGIRADVKVVMYIGALEKWKGVEVLCASAKLLPPHTQVVVIGGRLPEVEKLRAQYPDVLFVGMRPYKEIAQNQSAADVLVVPNIPENKESAEYTSPIKLFAHMASGIPVVVSDLPSLRAIVNEESVCFFKAGNMEALANGIKNIFENPQDSKSRAEHAKVLVQKFTWEARAISILSPLKKSLLS